MFGFDIPSFNNTISDMRLNNQVKRNQKEVERAAKEIQKTRTRANRILANKEFNKIKHAALIKQHQAQQDAMRTYQLARNTAVEAHAKGDPNAAAYLQSAKQAYDTSIRNAADAYTQTINEAKNIRDNTDYLTNEARGYAENATELDKHKDWQNIINQHEAENNDTDSSSPVGTSVGNAMSAYMANSFNKQLDPMDRSARLRNQADMHEREAADIGKNRQREERKANANYKDEAEKNALSKASTNQAKQVADTASASGAAALMRTQDVDPDYNTHMQRKDQAADKAYKYGRDADDRRQIAEGERSAASVYDYQAGDMARYNNEAYYLSRGGQSGEYTPNTPQNIPDDTVDTSASTALPDDTTAAAELPDDTGDTSAATELPDDIKQNLINMGGKSEVRRLLDDNNTEYVSRISNNGGKMIITPEEGVPPEYTWTAEDEQNLLDIYNSYTDENGNNEWSIDHPMYGGNEDNWKREMERRRNSKFYKDKGSTAFGKVNRAGVDNSNIAATLNAVSRFN